MNNMTETHAKSTTFFKPHVLSELYLRANFGTSFFVSLQNDLRISEDVIFRRITFCNG